MVDEVGKVVAEVTAQAPVKRKVGKPKGYKHPPKEVKRLSTRRMCELVDGSPALDRSEQKFLKRWAKLSPAEQMRRRLDMEPREKAPESAASTTVRMLLSGMPAVCPHCRMKISQETVDGTTYGDFTPIRRPGDGDGDGVVSVSPVLPVDGKPVSPHSGKVDSRSRMPAVPKKMVLPEPSGNVEAESFVERWRRELHQQTVQSEKDLLELNRQRDREGLPRLGSLPKDFNRGGYNPVDGF